MKEFLSQQGVAYIERDISQDEDALAELERMGVMTTPVAVKGETVVVGFDRAGLMKLIDA